MITHVDVKEMSNILKLKKHKLCPDITYKIR